MKAHDLVIALVFVTIGFWVATITSPPTFEVFTPTLPTPMVAFKVCGTFTIEEPDYEKLEKLHNRVYYRNKWKDDYLPKIPKDGKAECVTVFGWSNGGEPPHLLFNRDFNDLYTGYKK